MTSAPSPTAGDGLMAGQVALVTGASRGIGSAIALELARCGATVVVNYASSPEAAAAVVAAIEAAGGKAWSQRANVADEAEVEALVKAVLEREGRLDVLVNNAGITRDGLLIRMKSGDWQSVIDLNLTGCFLTTRAVAKGMLRARSGRIINITSVVGLMGNAGQANYSAAKAGLIGLTRSNAAEFAGRGVTVNAVAPGFIESDMTAALDSEPILRAIPLGRMGRAEEVAGAVRFLAADPAAAYITGQVLQVDGGRVMRGGGWTGAAPMAARSDLRERRRGTGHRQGLGQVLPHAADAQQQPQPPAAGRDGQEHADGHVHHRHGHPQGGDGQEDHPIGGGGRPEAAIRGAGNSPLDRALQQLIHGPKLPARGGGRLDAGAVTAIPTGPAPGEFPVAVGGLKSRLSCV